MQWPTVDCVLHRFSIAFIAATTSITIKLARFQQHASGKSSFPALMCIDCQILRLQTELQTDWTLKSELKHVCHLSAKNTRRMAIANGHMDEKIIQC